MRPYSYDARSKLIVVTDAGGNKTYFVYAAGMLLGTLDASGTLTAAYTWGPAGLVSERLLDTGTSRWYHAGPQTETRLLTDETGAVADTYTYTAYGSPLASTGTDPNPFRYGGLVGDYTDPVTGLIRCGARWYDPTSTRWLSRDPIGYDGGFNLYCYTLNNPVGKIDPSGLCGDPNQLNNDDMVLDTLGFIVPDASAPLHAAQALTQGSTYLNFELREM